jgi:hypothetical protein
MEATMKRRTLSFSLVGALIIGLATPAVASANLFGWGCNLQGTWIGVTSPEDTTLTGWVVTVAGRSRFHGTNNLEFPTFNPKLLVPFEPYFLYADAQYISSLRGAWMRTGFNSFSYTMTGIATAADGVTPVWVGKLSGTITLSNDCRSEEITATLETFDPSVSPFDGSPDWVLPLPTHYGYRARVDLP